MADDSITIEYELTLPSGERKRHAVRLDRVTMASVSSVAEPLPEWTRLGFQQCPNCPLDPSKHQRCPAAVALVEVVDSFKNSVSCDKADVVVKTPNRIYQKQATLQEVATSLMGLHMVTSGCPILDKLRPLVFTHLPFATADETFFRVVSMYLLAQFFRWKQGLRPDWELKNLLVTCKDLNEVNIAFGKRIIGINTADASLNALVSLDCLAGLTGMSISDDLFDDIESLFAGYLKGDPAKGDKAA
jgi:hypothetical protein